LFHTSFTRIHAYKNVSFFSNITGIFDAFYLTNEPKGTTNINCNEDDCNIRIIPYHTIGISHYIPFHRSQIGPAAAVTVDLDGIVQYAAGNKLDSYDSYTMTLDPMGYSEDDDEEEKKEDNDNLMEEFIRENAVVTDDQIKNMETFGSAAMTDPALIKRQVEAHRRKDRDLTSYKTKTFNKKKRQTSSSDKKLPSLDELQEFIQPDGIGRYTLVIRKYNIGHTKRRVGAIVNRINGYRQGNRQRLNIRENRNVIWQGILGMVLGIFSFLLSLLIGQYSEPKSGVNRRANSQRRVEQSKTSFSGRNMSNSSSRSYSSTTSYGNRPKAYGGYSGYGG
jgi:hypothetical protein